jgi:hypothetical protein
MDALKIDVQIHITGNETYPIKSSLYIGVPTSLMPRILLGSGLFRSKEAAREWGITFSEILAEKQEWIGFKSMVELDQWVLMMTPPDDFERDHAQ